MEFTGNCEQLGGLQVVTFLLMVIGNYSMPLAVKVKEFGVEIMHVENTLQITP